MACRASNVVDANYWDHVGAHVNEHTQAAAMRNTRDGCAGSSDVAGRRHYTKGVETGVGIAEEDIEQRLWTVPTVRATAPPHRPGGSFPP